MVMSPVMRSAVGRGKLDAPGILNKGDCPAQHIGRVCRQLQKTSGDSPDVECIMLKRYGADCQ
jgi:hypothetical protein